MKYIFKTLTITLITVLAVIGCKKSPIDKLGPDLCPSGSFTLTTDDILLQGLNASNELDLVDSGLSVRAYFSEEVVWSVRITSNESSKLYSGEGDSINFHWYGNSDNLPLFDIGTATITLSVGCRDDVKKSFEVKGKSDFSKLHGSFGVLMRDWSKNGKTPILTTDRPIAGGDGFYYGGGIKGGPGLPSPGFVYTDTLPSPMGGTYFSLKGESDAPVWYFGACEMLNVGTAFNLLSTTNPDSIYLNILTRTGGDANVQIQLALLRTTDLGDPLDFGDDETTAFTYNLNADWTDWKYISVKLSDFTSGGESISSTTEMNTLSLAMGAAPFKASVGEVNYDFVLLTVGEPFIK